VKPPAWAWVLRETVLAMHDLMLAEFGGAPGIRDEGLLDSALARPQHLTAYDKPNAFALAASLAFGLIKNHPFVDGNKRVGFASAVVFLEINGYTFHATEVDATIQTLALAANGITESDYAAWLEQNTRKRTRR
jgi:death-on-curing protein